MSYHTKSLAEYQSDIEREFLVFISKLEKDLPSPTSNYKPSIRVETGTFDSIEDVGYAALAIAYQTGHPVKFALGGAEFVVDEDSKFEKVKEEYLKGVKQREDVWYHWYDEEVLTPTLPGTNP